MWVSHHRRGLLPPSWTALSFCFSWHCLRVLLSPACPLRREVPLSTFTDFLLRINPGLFSFFSLFRERERKDMDLHVNFYPVNLRISIYEFNRRHLKLSTCFLQKNIYLHNIPFYFIQDALHLLRIPDLHVLCLLDVAVTDGSRTEPLWIGWLLTFIGHFLETKGIFQILSKVSTKTFHSCLSSLMFGFKSPSFESCHAHCTRKSRLLTPYPQFPLGKQ